MRHGVRAPTSASHAGCAVSQIVYHKGRTGNHEACMHIGIKMRARPSSLSMQTYECISGHPEYILA